MTTTLTEADAPKKNSYPGLAGAPLGNFNSFRHGMRGSGLPKGCGHIQKATLHFRRQLETEVLTARGEITLVDAAYVNTAFRAERHAQLAQRWLASEATTMTPADRLAYSREVVRGSADRDKAIAALGLPKRASLDPWGALSSSHHVNGNGAQELQATTNPPAATDAAAGHTAGQEQ
jgi:hypothetical protein